MYTVFICLLQQNVRNDFVIYSFAEQVNYFESDERLADSFLLLAALGFGIKCYRHAAAMVYGDVSCSAKKAAGSYDKRMCAARRAAGDRCCDTSFAAKRQLYGLLCVTEPFSRG